MTFTVMSTMCSSNKALEESVIEVNVGKLRDMLVERVQEAHAWFYIICVRSMFNTHTWKVCRSVYMRLQCKRPSFYLAV